MSESMNNVPARENEELHAPTPIYYNIFYPFQISVFEITVYQI